MTTKDTGDSIVKTSDLKIIKYSTYACIHIYSTLEKYFSATVLSELKKEIERCKDRLKNRFKICRWIKITKYLVHQHSVISEVMNLHVSLVRSPYVPTKSLLKPRPE